MCMIIWIFLSAFILLFLAPSYCPALTEVLDHLYVDPFHGIADLWMQNTSQCCNKSLPVWHGFKAAILDINPKPCVCVWGGGPTAGCEDATERERDKKRIPFSGHTSGEASCLENLGGGRRREEASREWRTVTEGCSIAMAALMFVLLLLFYLATEISTRIFFFFPFMSLPQPSQPWGTQNLRRFPRLPTNTSPQNVSWSICFHTLAPPGLDVRAFFATSIVFHRSAIFVTFREW